MTTSTVVSLGDEDFYTATLEVYDSVFDGSDPVSFDITVESECIFVGKTNLRKVAACIFYIEV